ncbi:class I SAM-dependent methyltransferase [Vulgatibacter sp.]|uniref:class I SAM-dependent methyltransferase n=1 Tax=Vulgatibacter sp. TaxID=1971226 RepID=UPI0035690A1E
MNPGAAPSTNLQKYESGSRILQLLIRRFHGRIGDLLQGLSFETVLDVGCGEGFLSRVLLDRFPGIQLTGIDLSATAVEHARLRCPEGRFEAAPIESLATMAKQFDLVVCSEVLEHLEAPEEAVRLLAARSSGHALITVPWEPWFQAANFARGKYLRSWGNHPEHIQHWSRAGLVRLLEPAFVPLHTESRFPWSLCLARPRNER